MKLIRIPQTFFDDHYWRELPTPNIVKSTKQHYWIYANENDEGYVDLLDDADMYASDGAPDWDEGKGIRLAAKALIKAINKQK